MEHLSAVDDGRQSSFSPQGRLFVAKMRADHGVLPPTSFNLFLL